MENMFRRWALVEPERCKPHPGGGFKVGGTLFRAFDGVASDALLRREVQRALTEQGLSWQIDLGYPMVTHVTCPKTGHRFEGLATEYPGEALLDAYLELLNAVRPR